MERRGGDSRPPPLHESPLHHCVVEDPQRRGLERPLSMRGTPPGAVPRRGAGGGSAPSGALQGIIDL
ncbi:hypothetical protein Tter_1787 [Thermobaculum terrenum ATCC BAA-798]|uniref:Uncharacterized protein n=1 Tax=Thermobaculum terrenum (strain ATCC BAA-798 / CCMEE 7001 / YNP1) TaxID=525904 RepID=D1CD28_THET1|nr:hypothetical protein Tter_1787 [Thermobaculum terrenum ATCC BAA-798]